MNEVIRELDEAHDLLCHAASLLDSTNDWIAADILLTLEGMIDTLGDRVSELRAIRKAVRGVRNDNT